MAEFFHFRKPYAIRQNVPSSAIYECSACKNITAFRKGEKFTYCPDCPGRVKGQTWHRTNEFVYFVSRNVNTEFDRLRNASVRAAEFIADFAGNIWFAYFHVLWFCIWIWLNTGSRTGWAYGGFDPYPFPFLVLVVSLEAIFLATFILIAQNIQGTRSEIRADLDYRTNLKTEKDVAEMLSILNDIREGRMVVKGKRIVFDRK